MFAVEYMGEDYDNTQIIMFTTSPRQSTIDFRSIYFRLNTAAVLLHILNAIGVGIAHETHLRHIKQGYLFVSPQVNLQWTNHALVRTDSTENKCSYVSESRHFKATIPALNENESVHRLFPPREPFPDFMRVFNFSGTDLIQYNRGGHPVNLNMMILSFCLLSVVFQTTHGVLLYYFDDIPRFLHYLEYAFSSPLMVMVMAVEVGILELFLVISLGGLFFGMNIVGMCAEILSHYTGYITSSRGHLWLCSMFSWLLHFTGWILFLLAMIPVWAQFHQVLACSENGGTPQYVYAVIVLESVLFFFFGILQIAALREKLAHVWKVRDNASSFVNLLSPIPVSVLFKYDCVHALLSLVAKTILTWLLLGPALTVDLGTLVDRVGAL